MLVCVIASLCFSVGEGLRLRPFPVSDSTTNTQLSVNASPALTRYGPVDLPTRAQNRGKRQTVEFGSLPAQDYRELTAHQVLFRETGEGVTVFSGFRFTSTGRAPPFIS